MLRANARDPQAQPAHRARLDCGLRRQVSWREPQAGAIALVRYHVATSSLVIAERVRTRQSTLIVPGIHVGLEGYLRVWLGGREPFLREAFGGLATS